MLTDKVLVTKVKNVETELEHAWNVDCLATTNSKLNWRWRDEETVENVYVAGVVKHLNALYLLFESTHDSFSYDFPVTLEDVRTDHSR